MVIFMHDSHKLMYTVEVLSFYQLVSIQLLQNFMNLNAVNFIMSEKQPRITVGGYWSIAERIVKQQGPPVAHGNTRKR
jgi:hypothetical protein